MQKKETEQKLRAEIEEQLGLQKEGKAK